MAVNKRVAKEIKDKNDINFLINLKEKDISTSMIMELFGEFKGKRRFNPYDIITIPTGEYGGTTPDGKEKKNKKPFVTTVGRLIFNKFFIEEEPQLLDFIGYVNKNVSKKNFEKIYDDLGYGVLEGKVSIEVYKKFNMKTQKVMPYVSILSPSHSNNMLTITEKLNKRKEALLKEHKAELDKEDFNSAVVLDGITKELMDYARELLKDDPAMDMFMSGAGGTFENNFKNIFIMRGAVLNPDPAKGYNIITSNYVDGVSKDDYAKLANTLSAGPYSRSKKTELGGAWEKLFLAALQHVILDEPGSDCKTKRYITMKVTDKNIDSIMYCYVINNDGSLTEITSENKNKFIGKKIKLRFSSMCESKTGICNKCAGNLFYRLGIKNIGVATPQIASRLKLLSMKLFHDDQMSFTEMDPMAAFCPED